jgi:hypothetical protein
LGNRTSTPVTKDNRLNTGLKDRHAKPDAPAFGECRADQIARQATNGRMT